MPLAPLNLLSAAAITFCLLLAVPAQVLAEAPLVSPEQLVPSSKHIRTAKLVLYHINRLHYRNLPLDDSLSREILRRFIESLDGNRSYFTDQDIRRFSHYSDKLDDGLNDGELFAPFEIFRTYRQRVESRIDYAISKLDRDFDYTVDEEYQFDRSETPWTNNTGELDEIWRKRVKNDLLSLKLAEGTTADPKDTLRKRYQRIKRRTEQLNADDVFAVFINAYATAIEPHTRYFPPRDSENFRIRMSLSLQGIGAVLQSENEHTVVRRVVPGGPAEKTGELKSGDKIIGVGQASTDIVDVVGWRLDDVVDLIRGAKNTKVNLRLLTKAGGADAKPKVIEITRDTIQLEEQAARKKVIEISGASGTTRRIGVIDLDTFYIDFDARAAGDRNYRSTTRDVKILLAELEKEKIDGLIIDLRGNGGGSLAEATSLTGLFIPAGPIVQVQDNNGRLQVNEDPDPELINGGPMAVMVDRDSASASEIFAGAIQDYHRGLIIGESTYGKGTVQNLLDLNRHSRDNEQLGQLKVTIAQFFRVDGGSTQYRGVQPDVSLPAPDDIEEYGERAQDNALRWSTVRPARFIPTAEAADNRIINKLQQRHEKRVVKDAGYTYLLGNISAQREALDTTSVTLHMENRRTEQDAQDDRQLARINEYRQAMDLKPVDKIENSDEGFDEENTFEDKLADISVFESARILVDNLELSNKTFALSPENKADTANN